MFATVVGNSGSAIFTLKHKFKTQYLVLNHKIREGVMDHVPGRDSSVGIATCYGQDGLGFPMGCEIFRTRPDRSGGPHSFLYSGYWIYFPGVKAVGVWR